MNATDELRRMLDESEGTTKSKVKTLYICDGKACRKHRGSCYLYGGCCFHTEKANHSISLNDPDFPKTTTNMIEGTLLEEIDNAKFIYDYVNRGHYHKQTT